MSLSGELLKAYEHRIESLTLVPSSGGVFEVSVNGELLFSKKALRRHAAEGEILALLRPRLGPPAGEDGDGG